MREKLFFILPIVLLGLLLELGIVYHLLGTAMEKVILDDAINRAEAAGDRVAAWVELKKRDAAPLNPTAMTAEDRQSLQRLLDSLWLGDNGFSCLLAGDGRYIIAPPSSAAETDNIFRHPDPAFNDLGRRMLSSKAGFYRWQDKAGQHLIGIHYPVAGTNWGLAAVMHEQELFAPVRGTLALLLAITAVLALITAGGIGFILSRMHGGNAAEKAPFS